MKKLSSNVFCINAHKIAFINACFASIIIFLLATSTAFGQYEKNPLMPIINDGADMVVEKFVQIPDDEFGKPRLNTFTFYGDRIFVASEHGEIYEIVKDGSTNKAVLFFDVKKAITDQTDRELVVGVELWHAGLRSVAFHPEFDANGKFYTSIMETSPSNTSGHKYLGDNAGTNLDGVVVEWTYNSDLHTATYRELFRVNQPSGEHPLKEVKFNRYAQPSDEDYGLLYITHGDGTDPNNRSVKGTGQKNDAFGKILRINPLQSDTQPYTIPSTNPFVGNANWLPEIYSMGHRNPHTVCFGKDELGNVHLIISEVGLDNMEEINLIEAGGNYGWGEREGTYLRDGQGNGFKSGIKALPDDDAKNNYIYPAAQFSNSGPVGGWFNGHAIAGGYVYTIPGSRNKIYLSADFPKSGRVFHVYVSDLLEAVTKLKIDDPKSDKPMDLTQAVLGEVKVLFDHDNNLSTAAQAKTSMKEIISEDPNYQTIEMDKGGRADIRFGQDKEENLYIMNKRNGWVYKIQSISQPNTPPGASVPVGLVDEIVNQFSAYPNPVSREGILHLSFSKPIKQSADIFAVSLAGQRILLGKVNSGQKEIEINLSQQNMSTGYYIIHLYSNDVHESHPIIIK